MFGSEIVLRELKSLAQRIADNIRKNGQTASGRSERSLNVQDEGDSIVLYGRKAFETLERGVPPLGDRIQTRSFAHILHRWAMDKGISFSDDKERWSFAFSLAKKIKREGSALYRDGGRADVYSNEIPRTIENVRNRISRAFKMEVENIKLNTDAANGN